MRRSTEKGGGANPENAEILRWESFVNEGTPFSQDDNSVIDPERPDWQVAGWAQRRRP